MEKVPSTKQVLHKWFGPRVAPVQSTTKKVTVVSEVALILTRVPGLPQSIAID